jgi:hypothetical protein
MKAALESQDVKVPVSPKLMQNFDSTQYTVGESAKGYVWVSRDKRYTEPRTLNQGVKLYTVMTADGVMGPMVYVIAADNKMELQGEE